MNKIPVSVVRVAVAVLLTHLSIAQEKETKVNKVSIQPEGPMGSFIGCIRPVLSSAGSNWSAENLQCFLGSAFAFSMQPNGDDLWQGGNYEWLYFFPMLNHFGSGMELYSGSLKGENPKTPEEFHALKKNAWEKIRKSIDQGVPAVIWQAMTAEQRTAGKAPLPHMWSVIVGYNEKEETYIVRHAGAGEFTIRWDAVGHSDPINWFCVIVVHSGLKLEDAKAAHRAVILRAVESSEGKYPGADGAAYHGLGAWEIWLKSFHGSSVNVGAIKNHADFLIRSRGAVANYLRENKNYFPEGSQKTLVNAAVLYEEEVSLLKTLLEHFAGTNPDLKKGAETLNNALEKERAAVGALKLFLSAK